MAQEHISPDPDLVAVMSRVAKSLRGSDIDEILRSIVQAALDAVPGADFASISMSYPDGSNTTLASTGHTAQEADQLQYELGEGPCLTAVRTGETVRSEDLTTGTRWPVYRERVASLGIGSQMAVEIFRSGSSRAGLNLYSKTVGAFDASHHIAELLASQAAIAMDFVHTAQTLQQAMLSRKTIGQAIGIVMERYHLDEDRAFAFLVRTSQDSNVKLRAVAQRIVDHHNRTVAQAPSSSD